MIAAIVVILVIYVGVMGITSYFYAPRVLEKMEKDGDEKALKAELDELKSNIETTENQIKELKKIEENYRKLIDEYAKFGAYDW